MQSEKPSLADDARQIALETRAAWRAQPDKLLFGILFFAWVALFQFFGNATIGTNSLFYRAYQVFNSSPDDNYCLYVPLVILGLFVWKRDELMTAPKRNYWPAIGMVFAGLALHVVGHLSQQVRVSIIAFFVGLYGLTGLVWGRDWLRVTFFPMILSVYCIPLGAMADTLTLPLRLIVTKVSVAMGHDVLGISVFCQGSLIMDGAGTALYDVAPACSGIRSLVSLLAIATVMAFVSYQSWWKRLAMMAVAVPLAMLGNIARITTVIVVGEAFGKGAGVMIEQKFGFLTFAFALIGLMVVGHYLKAEPRVVPAPELNRATA